MRGLARGLDVAVQIAILEAAGQCMPLLPAERLVSLSGDALVYVDVLVGFTALILYTTVSEWRGGATFGKLVTGMRVVDVEGGAIGPRAAFVRNLALLVDALFVGLVAYSAMARSERKQRVGDGWAGTVVVWKGDAPEETRPPLGWIAGAAGAFALVVASYLVA